MNPVDLFLLTIAAIFFVGVVGELVFDRTGVPDVVWLVVVGLLLGPVLGVVDAEPLLRVAPFFGALTLVVVLFDGGTSLRLGPLLKAAPRSLLLAIVSFTLSVTVVAIASMLAAQVGLLPSEWTWLHGALLGCILGGSSSVVIMPAMQKAGLGGGLANLVNLESAVTDVLCVVSTVALIHIFEQGSADMGEASAALGRAFGIGLGIGLLGGIVWMALHGLWRGTSHEYPVTIGALLILYVLISRANGSAALGILTTAIIMGNAGPISKRLGFSVPIELNADLASFHDRITFMIKSFFFTFIGLMLRPPWSLIGLGVALAAFLVVVRPPAVWLATMGSGMTRPARLLITVLMPRGMAAGVLAMLPHFSGVPGTEELPVVVFACVLATILVFACGFPIFRRRLPIESATKAFDTMVPGDLAVAPFSMGRGERRVDPNQ